MKILKCFELAYKESILSCFTLSFLHSLPRVPLFSLLLERQQKRVMEHVCHENRRGTSLDEGRKRIFLTPNYPDSTPFNWHPPVRSFKVPFQFSIVKHLLHLRYTPHHPHSCMSHLHRHSQPERKITPASSLWAHFSLLTQSFIHSHAYPSSMLMVTCVLLYSSKQHRKWPSPRNL